MPVSRPCLVVLRKLPAPVNPDSCQLAADCARIASITMLRNLSLTSPASPAARLASLSSVRTRGSSIPASLLGPRAGESRCVALVSNCSAVLPLTGPSTAAHTRLSVAEKHVRHVFMVPSLPEQPDDWHNPRASPPIKCQFEQPFVSPRSSSGRWFNAGVSRT